MLTKNIEEEEGDPNNVLVLEIDAAIKKIVVEGNKNTNHFRLYVTGYGQFSNEKDRYCDTVTFARSANPNPDGKEHAKMTRDLREGFNAMSRMLNKAIKAAVGLNGGSKIVL